MKALSFMTIILLAVVVVGCDVGTVVNSGSPEATVDVLGKAPHMVPIKGKATFAADLTVVPPVLECGHGEVFFRRFDGEGIYSHLGAGTFVGMSDACWVDLNDLTLGVTGSMTFTASNGDELWGVWGLQGVAGANEGVVDWSFYAYDGDHPVEFIGGTGRFEGAHGYAAGAGTFDYADLSGTYWFEGMLSSVGSLK